MRTCQQIKICHIAISDHAAKFLVFENDDHDMREIWDERPRCGCWSYCRRWLGCFGQNGQGWERRERLSRCRRGQNGLAAEASKEAQTAKQTS
jgi:hypothetical protein